MSEIVRKLSSIQRISKLHKLDVFDNLLLCEVQGWRCLVKKEEFKEGDLCVYFEVDSLLPDKPVFEFMRRYKFRVKTIKMKGTYSQGLCLPINIFDELKDVELEEGLDVTEILGVKKYEIPDDLRISGDVKGSFPGFLLKTDVDSLVEFSKGMSMVNPQVFRPTGFLLKTDVDSLVEFSKRMSMVNPQVLREGLVFRPISECIDLRIGRVSFKVVNPDFLIKYD